MMVTLDEIIATNNDGSGFHNYDKLLKYGKNQRVWFIIGARRIGKTLSALRLACRAYLLGGYTTMWLRNYKEHMKRPEFFNNFLNAAISRGWCPDTWIAKPEGIFENEEDKHPIIGFQGLNTFSESRGNEYPYSLMIQDEFMDEQRKYPQACVTGLMSLTATVFAGREDCRVIMMSNFISCANPYFAQFRLMPDRKKDVTVFADSSIAVEVCRNYRQAPIKEGEWGKFYKAGGYGDYAEDTEDSLFSLISRPPTGCRKGAFAIVTKSGTYTFGLKSDMYYWYEAQKVSKDVDLFTADMTLVTGEVLYFKAMVPILREWMEGGRCRYADSNVLFEVMGTMYAGRI